MVTAVYVHVRHLAAFQRLVQHYPASRADLARRAGLSRQRLHQLVSGASTTTTVNQAAALEDALDVPRGTAFTFPDVRLAAPYAHVAPRRPRHRQHGKNTAAEASAAETGAA